MTSAPEDFLAPVADGRDWKALELAVLRILEHCGWTNLQYVGESGDMGADILGVRYNPVTSENESYLFQVKAVSGDNYVDAAAVTQAVRGQGFYGTNIAVIATIMVVGLGGQYYFGGNIPFPGFSGGIPCIAGAAISGILLNLLLSIGEKKES